MAEKIFTDKAPAAIGPYSQAIKAGNTVYTSGQIALSPESGVLVGDNIKDQTEQVCRISPQCLQRLALPLTV